MIEVHKEVARFRMNILHEKTGEMVELKAIIEEMPDRGLFGIRYSHTYKPEETAGPYYSNSFTLAESYGEAEAKMGKWASQISTSHEVCPWTDI